MWRFYASQVKKTSQILLKGNLKHNVRNFSVSVKKSVKFPLPLFSGFVVGYGVMKYCYSAECNKVEEDDTNDKWTLYQYATCPFCCKVRTFLEFYGIDYDIVEVNPVFRNEIKFSDYKKVPILKSDKHQLNDSSLIISILKTHLLGKGDVETLLAYYPKLESQEKKKKVVEYQNRYNIMYQEGLNDMQHKAVREEAKWRKWVDDTFIHTLSPNIYRTMGEALRAMEYITHVGNFSSFERTVVYYSGAVAMYIIGKRLKKKYNLKDNVRESMYAEARVWAKAVGMKRKFLGGKTPNLADLNMYGVIHAIEGLDAFDDLMKNTNILSWYREMKIQVESHAGAKQKDWLIKN